MRTLAYIIAVGIFTAIPSAQAVRRLCLIDLVGNNLRLASLAGTSEVLMRPATLKSSEEFLALPDHERYEILRVDAPGRGIMVRHYKKIGSIRSASIKEFAIQLLEAAESASPDKDTGEFDAYVTVGKPTWTMHIATLKNGTILGGTITFVQNGDNPNEENSDVSWSWRFTMGADGSLSDLNENYWEWGGH